MAPQIGERVRTVRERTGRSQAAVAGLSGITTDYLSQIERGRKTPSVDVLLALAHTLGVPPADLLDDRPARLGPATAPSPSPVTRAFLAPTGSSPASGDPRPLRDRVHDAWRRWQTAPDRYTHAETLLPDLITDTGHAQHTGDAAQRREAHRCAADLHGLLRSYFRRTGRPDLSVLAADRSLRAAQDADDPLRGAVAAWNLGQILLGQHRAEEADDVVAAALAQLHRDAPGSRARAALSGALDLVTVLAAAQRRRWWPARDRLNATASTAEQVGETNTGWTVFGPANVAVHRLALEMAAGEAREALRVADRIDTTVLPSRERRFTFSLEVAGCYALLGEDAAVLVHLLDLEDLAPQDLERSEQARTLVRELRHRVRPTYRRQVTALADRLGL